MELPFVTLKKYSGQVVESSLTSIASMGGDQGVLWRVTDNAPSWAAGATAAIFEARGDQLRQVYKLDYPDINGLGNHIYRLDGDQLSFCLKVLGDAAGNERETRVWELLGYGEANAKKPGIAQIKGLPPRKFTFVDRQLRTVLTPYYPGVLKAVSGGAYEFPLVICAALYVEETLSKLHAQGLAYMDLCPANILFKTTPQGAILFFLTDMGGVKPLCGHPGGPAYEELLEIMVPRRWTRREVLPPTHLFAAHDPDPRLEPGTGYDYYTLARTCHILLGLGPETEVALVAGPELCLEDPMRPLAGEMSRFLELIEPWLRGQVPNQGQRQQTRQQMRELFRQFFVARTTFVNEYLSGDDLSTRWCHILKARLNRYRMALHDYQELADQVEQAPSGNGGLSTDLACLNGLVNALLSGNFEASLAYLQEYGQSRLVRVSRIANYAFFHHKKLVRGKFGGTPGLSDRLLGMGAKLEQSQPLAEEPEVATSKALRRGEPSLELGILKRVI